MSGPVDPTDTRSGLDEVKTAVLRQLAIVLLPGDDIAPSAGDVVDLDRWIHRAVLALGSEAHGLGDALATAPAELNWDNAKRWCEDHSEQFELAALVASAAYFMTPEALKGIDYPSAKRKAARNDQIVDELETGVLDDVMARESMFRQVSA